jgi:hypothetical protein
MIPALADERWRIMLHRMWHSCPQPHQFAGPLAPCAEHFVIEHMIADGSCFDVIECAIAMPPLGAHD